MVSIKRKQNKMHKIEVQVNIEFISGASNVVEQTGWIDARRRHT
jgi:hypothetical protein